MNICHFTGRLTKDADIRTTSSGMEIATFTLAVDCGYGEKKRTEFINCKRFKPGGFAQYLVKGKSFVVTTEYCEDRWEKDGQKHSRPSWIVRDMEFGQGDRGQQPAAQPAYTGRQDMSTMDDMGPSFDGGSAGGDDAPFAPFEAY